MTIKLCPQKFESSADFSLRVHENIGDIVSRSDKNLLAELKKIINEARKFIHLPDDPLNLDLREYTSNILIPDEKSSVESLVLVSLYFGAWREDKGGVLEKRLFDMTCPAWWILFANLLVKDGVDFRFVRYYIDGVQSKLDVVFDGLCLNEAGIEMGRRLNII
ncbi:MAG: hypothetical protein LBS23_00130 [Holosporaceae bacterium]|nr:hypothetical protein [Holosporaceae bacterium]